MVVVLVMLGVLGVLGVRPGTDPGTSAQTLFGLFNEQN